jgi:tripartite-type tricarboxylate transporter receptor subunit TctC
LAESGLADLPTGNWNGVVAPAGTPTDIVAKLNSAINDSLNSREMQTSFKRLGLEPMMGSPGDFTARLIDEAPKWAAVVKSSGARID